MDYNPLKGILVLISSLKLSTVPYAAGPEGRGNSRTGYGYGIYRCQAASQVSLFAGFLIPWVSLPMKTTKIGTPRIKVIPQYLNLHPLMGYDQLVVCHRFGFDWLTFNEMYIYIVTVCVFVRYLFSFYPFYFDFHRARIIFDVSSGFYLWNINKTS